MRRGRSRRSVRRSVEDAIFGRVLSEGCVGEFSFLARFKTKNMLKLHPRVAWRVFIGRNSCLATLLRPPFNIEMLRCVT